ncbi:Ig-like domain-containing protein, partial [Planktothrix mougeotii]
MATFQEKTGADNPLNGVDVGNNSAPVLVDVDGDGDLDAFIGNIIGEIKYFQNNNGSFTEQIGAANPFNGVDVGILASPSFADVDKDGDLDAFIGNRDGNIKYFQNNNGSFTEQIGAANPFNGVDVGTNSNPSFADIDKDGDLDAFIGNSVGNIKYFQNNNGSFTEQIGAANPFNSVNIVGSIHPSFADLDRDGDLDAFMGNTLGTIRFYQNNNGSFTEQIGAANPLNSVDVGNNSTPNFTDIDKDGDLDAFVGLTDGSIKYFQNTTPPSPPLINGFLPTNNQKQVPLATDLIVNFDQPILKGVGNIVIIGGAGNIFETLDINSPNITINNNELVINPTNNLAGQTPYEVRIPQGAVQGLSGLPLATSEAWAFTTFDNIAPTINLLNPADNSIGRIALSGNISIIFNEAISKGTGNIVIKKLSDNSIFETIPVTSPNITIGAVSSISGTPSRLLINPTNDFASETEYYVEIDNTAIKDLSGNAFAGLSGNSAWNFKTIDRTPPALTSLSPTDNATGVAVGDNLIVTFNEPIQKNNTGNVTIKKLSDGSIFETLDVSSPNLTTNGNQLTINPITNLAPGTEYYVEIAPATLVDLAAVGALPANPFSGISGSTAWNFTTVPDAVNLSINPTTGSEAGTTSITVTATAALPVVGDQTVDLALTGTATAADFAGTIPNKITISDGSITGQVTFTITDDNLDEIDETATLTMSNPSAGIVLGPTTTGSFTITDNDTAGFEVQAITGHTSEAGGTASFDIRLKTQPTADVTFSFSSNNTAEGTVSATPITFTPANWNVYQTVTVTGVDDAVIDLDKTYQIVSSAVTSTDPKYSNIKPADIDVINTDNDSAGVTITQTGGSTDVTEGGANDTYTIQLNTLPIGNVTVTVTSDAQSQISTDGTTFSNSQAVTFTPTNGMTPQTITVKAVDDNVAEHNHSSSITHAITTSATPNYPTTLAIGPVNAQITDNDITYNVVGSTTTITEGNQGSQVITFTITRGGETQQASSIDFSFGGNASAGTDYNNPNVTGTGVSVTGSTINFAANATTATIAVEILGDAQVEPDETLSLTLSNGTPAGTATITGSPLNVTLTNDDTAGIVLKPKNGLTTTEAGGQDIFNVRLSSQPSADVTIGLTSDNTAEGILSANSVTFTPSNWNIAQNITVTGVDDNSIDGNKAYKIVTADATSTDTNYSGLVSNDIGVTNLDNDIAGFTISPISSNTTEAGGTSTFTIQLKTQPTADVTLPLSSDNTAEGTVLPASVTFNSTNWNQPQTVTVNGVDDSIADGNQTYNIVTGVATSTDTNYNGVDPNDIGIDNIDNDVAGVTISAISGNTTEAGGTATFTVQLSSQPTADVSFNLSSDNPGEGSISANSLTFDATNWNIPQTVTVTGIDDIFFDGDKPYNIVTAAISSQDPSYNGINPNDIAVTNTDNDSPGFIVVPVVTTTTEAGGTGGFAVYLNGQPTADVTLPLSSDNTNEGTVTPAALTFNATNWDIPQIVTVLPVDDNLLDGDKPYNIVTGVSTSTDTRFNGIDPNDIPFINSDNETPTVVISPISGNTTEAGGAATFTIQLNGQPTGDVTIPLSSDNTAEGTVAPAAVTFNSTNWNTPQIVTVTGVDDTVIDGDAAYNIVTGASTSTDTRFNGIDPNDIAVINSDNDVLPVDSTPPEVVSLTPTDDATGVAVGDNLIIKFSEAIQIGSGNIVIKKLSDNSIVETLNVNSPKVSIGTNKKDKVASLLILNPTADLATSTDYYVEIPPTAITDLAGNPYSGISGNTTWNFKTVDASPAIPPVNLFLSQTTGTEAGTTSITVTAIAAAAVVGDQTLDLTLSGDASLADFVSPVPNQITIPNGSSSGQVTFTITDDKLDEIDETATLTLSNPSAGIVLGPDITDSFTIIDNDTAGFQLQPISGHTSETGGQASFGIRLTSQPTADVTLSFSSSNTAEGTVAATPITFTPGNWDSYQTITATGVDDLSADGDISYEILSTVTSADSNYNSIKPADVDVINTDNDIPGVTITQSGGSTDVIEGGANDTYEIQLNTLPLGDVEVTVTADAQSQISLDGVNFAASQIVNFTPVNGIIPQTLTVRAIDDGVAEHNHSSSITHAITNSTAPNYPTTRPIGSVNAQITDNDITYNVIGSTTSVTEGNTGSQVVSFTISRDGHTQQASSVDFSFGGTASVGTDYNNVNVTGNGVSATGSTINFAPNATTATIAVEILGDTVVEANETLELNLSNGNTAGTTTITGSPVSLTIQNDDIAIVDTTPPVVVSLTPTDDATAVAVGDNLIINFSEAIQIGTGNIVIKKLSDNSIVETLNVNTLNVSINNNQLILNPTADLATSTDYYVEIDPTAIQDLAGNPYSGISGNTTWNFKTVDASPAIPPVNLFLSQTTGTEAGTTSITVTAIAAAA